MAYRGKYACDAALVTRESIARHRSSRRFIRKANPATIPPATHKASHAAVASSVHCGTGPFNADRGRESEYQRRLASTAPPEPMSPSCTTVRGRVFLFTSRISFVKARRPRGIRHPEQRADPEFGQRSGVSAPHFGQTSRREKADPRPIDSDPFPEGAGLDSNFFTSKEWENASPSGRESPPVEPAVGITAGRFPNP